MSNAPRHGRFDALPRPDRTLGLAQARAEAPDAFSELSEAELASFRPDAVVEVEDGTGAMTVHDAAGDGAHWVFFPGEGWDAC